MKLISSTIFLCYLEDFAYLQIMQVSILLKQSPSQFESFGALSLQFVLKSKGSALQIAVF